MKRILALILALLVLLCACDTNTVQTVQSGDLAPLEVRFLDVGQADAALLRCGDAAMLIDGGNREDSSLIVSVLKRLELKKLDYLVCTHAHEDHVGGLAGALNFSQVVTVLTPVLSYDSAVFEKFMLAAEINASEITVPKSGDTFALGDATVTVLGPTEQYEETNDTSIVLKVELGEVSFLFTGDMEREAESDLLGTWSERDLAATVLKVGHHGSDTSTSYPFLRAVNPAYAVISVGHGNTYGHPTEEVLSRLQDADVTVYRTDLHGDVIATTDGKTVEFTTDKTPKPKPVVSDKCFIGNKNSKVFHLPSCETLPKEKNRVYFTSREAAFNEGFRPCENCDA